MKEKFQELYKKNWIWSAAAFGIPFLICVLICTFAGVYPFIADSKYSFFVVFGVVFVQGISHILTYYFASTLTQLLSADGRDLRFDGKRTRQMLRLFRVLFLFAGAGGR